MQWDVKAGCIEQTINWSEFFEEKSPGTDIYLISDRIGLGANKKICI